METGLSMMEVHLLNKIAWTVDVPKELYILQQSS